MHSWGIVQSYTDHHPVHNTQGIRSEDTYDIYEPKYILKK